MSADRDIDAAEYVLGTLDPDERLAFAALLPGDVGLQAAVSAWEGRFDGLESRIAPVAPSPTVWLAIERALNRGRSEPLRFQVIQGGGAGSPDVATKLRRSLNRWRNAAVVASGLAAALVAFVGYREIGESRGSAQGTTFFAAVNRGGDKPAFLVRVDLKSGTVHVRPVAPEAPQGKSLELWYISDGKAPRSMGVVDKAPLALTIPAGSHAEAATFAVSVEPPGGSTTGGPTGPVIYSGQLIQE